MFSRIYQHEYDHTLGRVFTERVSKLKLDLAKKKADKIMKKVEKCLATKTDFEKSKRNFFIYIRIISLIFVQIT